MRDRSRSLRRGTCHCAQQSGRFSPFQGLVSVWPRIRELTSSADTGRQERVTAWSVADRVRRVPPKLRTSSGGGFCGIIVSFGKPAAEPSSDGTQATRAMAIGSSSFDCSTCSALRSCAYVHVSALGLLDVLLASRKHECSWFV